MQRSKREFKYPAICDSLLSKLFKSSCLSRRLTRCRYAVSHSLFRLSSESMCSPQGRQPASAVSPWYLGPGMLSVGATCRDERKSSASLAVGKPGYATFFFLFCSRFFLATCTLGDKQDGRVSFQCPSEHPLIKFPLLA